jgi:predicted ester cyclase
LAGFAFVQHDVRHNDRTFGLAGSRAMLERDFAEIPDLRFNIELMVCEPRERDARGFQRGAHLCDRPGGDVVGSAALER